MPLSVYQAIFATFQKVAPLLKETAQMALMPQWKGVVGNIGFLSRGFSFFLHVSCKMKKQAKGNCGYKVSKPESYTKKMKKHAEALYKDAQTPTGAVGGTAAGLPQLPGSRGVRLMKEQVQRPAAPANMAAGFTPTPRWWKNRLGTNMTQDLRQIRKQTMRPAARGLNVQTGAKQAPVPKAYKPVQKAIKGVGNAPAKANIG